MNWNIVILLLVFYAGMIFLAYLQKKCAIERYNETLVKNPDAFPDCTNCVRYFDTVICKCKSMQEPNAAFLYPTDVTPDIDLNKITLNQPKVQNPDTVRMVPDVARLDFTQPQPAPQSQELNEQLVE